MSKDIINDLSGIKIELLNDLKEKSHFHPEIEILFVISGTVHINVDNSYHKLSRHDIVVFNSNNTHRIESIEESMICKIQISYKILADVCSYGNYVFYCNSVANKTNSYVELQDIMKRIIVSYSGPKKKTECLRYGLVFELLDILIENFQKSSNSIRYEKGTKSSEQKQYIINYINFNFNNNISLNDLAKSMYTSTSTLSRFFKKSFGIHFGDFVNKVRLNYAVRELLETDKTITKIAADCGFSNASTFSKNFQNQYNMSPTEYRKQEEVKDSYIDSLHEFNEGLFKHEVQLLKDEEDIKALGDEVIVQASSKELHDYKKFWNKALNAGSLHNLMFANIQSHIRYLVEELKFDFVRVWNVFSNKLMIQRNSNDYDYNFSIVDIALDFLLSCDVKPFIDFGKKPECAVKSEDETIFYEEEYIDFNSINEWNHMFESFIIHIIKRYGKEEVEQWKYEFSIDIRPDRFYVKDSEDNMEQLFERSFKLIKRYLPTAEVGGIGAAMGVNFDRTLQWLEYCSKNECVPDFVSILYFPYSHVEEAKKIFAKRTTKEDDAINQISLARTKLNENGFENCKLYVTEWNNSLSNRNYLNDSCFRGAYVAKITNDLWNIPDLMSVWMGSDLVSSYYDTSRIVNGASGLITKDKIGKPVYYALLFLNKMGGKLIKRGSNYIITSNGIRSYYIFCYNFKEYSYEYYLQSEDNLEINEFDRMFENNDDISIEINLSDMPEGQRFVIKKHRINRENGSILEQWGKFHYESDIEGTDVEYLNKICIPHIDMKKQVIENDILRIRDRLKSHEILLIHVYPDK